MQKIQHIRLMLIVVFTASLVAAGYEVRAAGLTFGGVPSYVIAAVSILLGNPLATSVVNWLLRVRRIRALITSSAHVEGYWYLTTGGAFESPLSPDGILYVSHEPSVGETRVVTTRLDSEGSEYPTVSEIAYVRCEGDNSYINYFRLTYPGSDVKFGLSSGRFIRSDDIKPFPNMLEAHINLAGENIVRRQSARRIDDKKVKRLQKKYGAEWKTTVLKAGRESLFTDGTTDAGEN